MIKGELPIYNPSFKAPSHLPNSFIEVFLCCCNPDQRFGCEVLPTPDLARKEGITPGIKNLREVGLSTSLGGGGRALEPFLDDRNRAKWKQGCPLSVLAVEEINLLGHPAFKEKFSDLLCIVLVNIYKLLESCLFIGQ